MEKTILDLPHELIVQILLRLPVKSLIRFKCVCKSWFSLISDPKFANSHFELTAATHTRGILFIPTSDLETRSIDLEASLNVASASLNQLSFMHPESYIYFQIKASCRGFIFLHLSSDIYLWNPTTGVHKQIPLSPIDSNPDDNCYCYLYGFGYDRSSDDYLVVSMSYDPALANISSHLEFFSLRANAWKEIEGTHLPYMNASDDPRVGSFFNGAIHWLAFRHDLDLSMNVIVAFDLMERKLFEMSLPDDFYHEPTYCDLWVFREFLSIWAMGDDTVEIWVMKEYKVHSSWTMTLVLSCSSIPTHYFSPICCTKSGDIIGTDSGAGLVKYDGKGHMLEHRPYCNDPRGSQVVTYTESLLSFPSDKGEAYEE